MLLKQIPLEFLLKHPEFIQLKDYRTIYSYERFEERSMTQLSDIYKNNETRVFMVFEMGNPIGVLIANGKVQSDLFSTKFKLVYLGIKKQRALAEFYLHWSSDLSYFVCVNDLTKEELNSLKHILKNHLEVTADGQLKFKEAEQQNRVAIRRYFEQNAPTSHLATMRSLFSVFNSWDVERLERYTPFIEQAYYQSQQEEFALLGDDWNLLVVYSQFEYIEDSQSAFDALVEKWENKGFVSGNISYHRQANLFEAFEVSRLKDNRVKVCIKYSVKHTLDHKYNDSSIPYYRHVLKRHIVDYYAKKNVHSVYLFNRFNQTIWTYDFTVHSENYGDLIFKNIKSFLKGKIKNKKHAIYLEQLFLRSLKQESFDFKDARLGQMTELPLRLLKKVAYHVSLEDAEKMFNQVFKPLMEKAISLLDPDKKEELRALIQKIHDTSLSYLDLFTNGHDMICTKTVIKKMLFNLSLNEFEEALNSMKTLVSLKAYSTAELRKLLYAYSRKKNFTELLTNLSHDAAIKYAEKIQRKERKAIKAAVVEMNLSSKTVLDQFLSRMRRYDQELSFTCVRDTLSLPVLEKMLKKEYDCVFMPEVFTPSYQGFGLYLKQLLKDGLIPNPKKLYNQLRKVKPVSELIEGDLTAEEGIRILSILKTFIKNANDWSPLFQLTAKVEEKGSPEFLMAGNASVCCMSFGASNALTYAKEQAFGILNLYYGDRVVGNSVLWVNQTQSGNALVLDNIEIHPNYKRIFPFLKDFYRQMIESLKKTYNCPFVLQGAYYNDFDLFSSDCLHGRLEDPTPVGFSEDNHCHFYTDATAFKVISDNQCILNQLNLQKGDEDLNWLRLTPEGFEIKKPEPIKNPFGGNPFGGHPFAHVPDADLPF